jgi:hypothetical protein
MIGSARVGLAILLVLPAVPREALCQIEFVLVNNSPEVREGLNQAESDANELPPDCSKAVGDGVLITTTNRTISVYDLDNLANAPDTLSLAEFFPFMPDLEPADDVFDARTIYDNHSGRFVVSAIGPSLQGGAGTKFLHVAYSNGDGVELPDEMSPGDWFFSSINGRELDFNCDGNSQNLGVDVPTLGYDHRAWYVSPPLIGSPLQAFKTSGVIYIVHKESEDDTEITKVFTRDFTDGAGTLGCGDLEIHSFPGMGTEFPCIAKQIDSIAPAAYAVGATVDLSGQKTCALSRSSDVIRLFAVSDPLDNEHANPTPDPDYKTRFIDMVVDCYGWDRRSVPLKSGQVAGAVDGRITSAVWRKIGDDEFLYGVQAVNTEVTLAGGTFPKTVIRWYQFKMNGWPDSANSPELFRSGEIDGGTTGSGLDARPVHLIMPAVMVNDAGDVVFVMGRTSAGEEGSELEGRLSIQASGRFHDDADGEVFDLTRIKVGSADGATIAGAMEQVLRFGDYFDAALDEDGETFWIFGEHIDDEGTPNDLTDDTWATFIAHVKMPD